MMNHVLTGAQWQNPPSALALSEKRYSSDTVNEQLEEGKCNDEEIIHATCIPPDKYRLQEMTNKNCLKRAEVSINGTMWI